jgi:5,10-methylenetetrahydromethanopterin reductase
MWVNLGLLAASTRIAKLGTFVADPYTYNPGLIASAIATIQEASGGRAILVLGAGGSGFAEMGIKRQSPLAVLEESFMVIRRLLDGELVTYEGKYVTLKNARLMYQPLSPPPIWIASRGDLILRLGGQLADGVMIATYATPKGINSALINVLEGCRKVGRDISSLELCVRVDVSLSSDSKLARDAVKPMIAGMIRASYPDQAFIRQAGLRIPEPLALLLEHSTHEEIRSAAKNVISDEFVNAFSWAGTPREVAAQVSDIMSSGIENICVVPHAPSGGDVNSVVESFVYDVIPLIQPTG